MTINKMTKHKSDTPNRNKTLDNLCMIFLNFSVGVSCPTKKSQAEVRKILLADIMKWLGCNKRTAYDYMLAVENIMEAIPQASRKAVIGGKKEHCSWDV